MKYLLFLALSCVLLMEPCLSGVPAGPSDERLEPQKRFELSSSKVEKIKKMFNIIRPIVCAVAVPLPTEGPSSPGQRNDATLKSSYEYIFAIMKHLLCKGYSGPQPTDPVPTGKKFSIREELEELVKSYGEEMQRGTGSRHGNSARQNGLPGGSSRASGGRLSGFSGSGSVAWARGGPGGGSETPVLPPKSSWDKRSESGIEVSTAPKITWSYRLVNEFESLSKKDLHVPDGRWFSRFHRSSVFLCH